MKFFIVCFIVGSLIAEGLSAPVENAEETNVEQVNERKATAETENVDGVRFRKATYGAPPAKAPAHGAPATYTYQAAAPAIPCAKNLLFSCQPSVAPVPCYAPAPAYPSYPAPAPAPAPASYAGAYSEPIAQWAYHPTINHLW